MIGERVSAVVSFPFDFNVKSLDWYVGLDDFDLYKFIDREVIDGIDFLFIIVEGHLVCLKYSENNEVVSSKDYFDVIEIHKGDPIINVLDINTDNKGLILTVNFLPRWEVGDHLDQYVPSRGEYLYKVTYNGKNNGSYYKPLGMAISLSYFYGVKFQFHVDASNKNLFIFTVPKDCSRKKEIADGIKSHVKDLSKKYGVVSIDVVQSNSNRYMPDDFE